MVKLGKLPAKIDKRTIPLKAILRKEFLPMLPSSYDLHEAFQIKDNFVFGNDEYGDCVKAARAHQTLVFEAFEQGKQIEITDKEVIDEYFKETGGQDSGLYLLESLKDWRNNGWPVGGRTYTIYAFAAVDWKDHEEVKHCIHLLGGVNFGMQVYSKDIEQFDNGEDWHLTGQNGYFRGGHGVYLYKYTDEHHDCPHCATGWDDSGLTCMTWGKPQRMTWDFWDARVDEAFGIVDNRNTWQSTSVVDVKKLDAYLKEITGETNSGCAVSRFIRKILK
jgi:hypothetical protein